ncbi:Bug family tripartite tricarboxylate transporter substrate binding protein [Orrella marina]|uniref:Tripartite tricarboxylate transporter substrate binding protein n=1 Tax=Orrella marina TaxID=2163011 RepID=A0A2R4XH21_9BURK|nr:tripartite tricarboxylate transporter substrate binding protein [Orrella marina]AWB33105.1 hypothetical protein DBV39_04555 [Orrella marina]
MFKLKKILLTAAVSGMTAIGVPAVASPDFPSQPIRLVVPYPAGGTTDMIGRIYADTLASKLDGIVVVDNKGGAATNIGSGIVATAKPDGYTLLFGSFGPYLNTILGPKPTFDPEKKLAPISMITRLTFMAAANPNAPFSTVKELQKLASESPGKYTIASAQLHHYIALMRNKTNLDLLHVPYKGGGPATTAAIGGQVDMVFALAPLLIPQVEAGSLKAIGLSSKQRLPAYGSYETFTENGIDFQLDTWFAVYAPAGIPDELAEKINAATKAVTEDPEFVARVSKIGGISEWSSIAALREEIQMQLASWRALVKDNPDLIHK